MADKDDFDDFLDGRLESDDEEDVISTTTPPTTTSTTSVAPSLEPPKSSTASTVTTPTTATAIATVTKENKSVGVIAKTETPTQATVKQHSDTKNETKDTKRVEPQAQPPKIVDQTLPTFPVGIDEEDDDKLHNDSNEGKDEMDDLDSLLNEAEKQDIHFSKEKNQEVVLQFWTHANQATATKSTSSDEKLVANSDTQQQREKEINELSELTQKLNQLLIPNVPTTSTTTNNGKKQESSKSSSSSTPSSASSSGKNDNTNVQKVVNSPEEKPATAATSSPSSTTTVEDEAMDEKQRRMLERQKQRQKLKQYLIQLEQSNASLHNRVQLRNERLRLAKQRWMSEREMFMHLFKQHDIDIDALLLQQQQQHHQPPLYQIEELDQIGNDDDESMNDDLYVSSIPAPLVTASEMISSLISSFSQPVATTTTATAPQQQSQHSPQDSNQQATATVPSATSSTPKVSSTRRQHSQRAVPAQSAQESSVLDSFKGWIWGSSPSSSPAAAATSTSATDASRRKKPTLATKPATQNT